MQCTFPKEKLALTLKSSKIEGSRKKKRHAYITFHLLGYINDKELQLVRLCSARLLLENMLYPFHSL